MDSDSLAGGVTGTLIVLSVGGVGKWIYGRVLAYYGRVDAATETRARTEADREARPWALMEERIDDLEAALKRVSESNDRKQEALDRLRDERDRLRLECIDWQIEAKKAGALARVTELQQQCDEERKAHHQIVERLSAEIRRLRGDH